ncbi:Glycosyltransferase, GT2 family [Chryseobacterium taichungense]|uniref:Glycosyltransferase, GT2 family n=1 Tax=Chryseobacterium taichungense TaxID=295069 RepID=A0A1H7ZGA1_9FLAO|nr:glycosyltransferase [Chryseobacterium taichungense]SEM57356.1 Glycosyltransferase, GT2 family [Chryseobacterium taichungense]
MFQIPLVSILCLCYNQERFITESLESIKSQTYSNIEILICDDFSKDHSVEVINNWIKNNSQLNIQFISHKENQGICKSLNELLNLSKGKYTITIALDDLMEGDKVERHVKILENSSPNEALVFSNAYLIDDHSVRFQNTFIPYFHKYLSLESGNFYETLLNDNFIPAMSCVTKSSLIKDIGGWDETLTFEDYDMWLRLSEKYDFIYDDYTSCSYRIHATNSHKKKDFLNASFFDIYLKHKEQPVMKKKILQLIHQAYKENKLTENHKNYLKELDNKTLTEKLILNNAGNFTYHALLFFQKIYYKSW